MLQATALRAQALPHAQAPIVICHEAHRFIVAEQLRQVDIVPQALILEPCSRNTAPALAIASLLAEKNDGDLLLVLPADHAIPDETAFSNTIRRGVNAAEQGHFVLFGIHPTHPETGYGYIKAGPMIDENVNQVLEFVEKPPQNLAQHYLETGAYDWNSGLFLLRARDYLSELQRFHPNLYTCCQAAWQQTTRDLDFWRLDPETFAQCPSDSIDYAVMERTKRTVLVRTAMPWSDVGTWSALWALGEKDAQNNLLRGEVVALNSHGNYIHSTHRLVAISGIDDLIVVETADSIMITPRDQAQTVKSLVALLEQQGRTEPHRHQKIYRPWGWYAAIETGDRFQVKRIVVHAGAQLSLQMHYHRAEHWVVVRGTARVTRGDESFLLTENQSTYIPLGVPHRLENPGKIDLEIIEIQSGSYLDEDDIVRFADNYGRT